MNNLDGYKRSITKLTEASAGLQGGGPTGLNLGGNNNIPGLAAAKTQKDQDEMLVRIHAAIDSGQKQLGQIVINALRDNAAPASVFLCPTCSDDRAMGFALTLLIALFPFCWGLSSPKTRCRPRPSKRCPI